MFDNMIITLKFIKRSPTPLLANWPRHTKDGFPNFQNSMAVKFSLQTLQHIKHSIGHHPRYLKQHKHKGPYICSHWTMESQVLNRLSTTLAHATPINNHDIVFENYPALIFSTMQLSTKEIGKKKIGYNLGWYN